MTSDERLVVEVEHLRVLEREVEELGRSAGAARERFADVAARVRVAVGDDEYGRAYREQHGPRLAAIESALAFLEALLKERHGPALRKAGENYREAERRSTMGFPD
ncbi:hypothetical protein Sru01_54870 [Sphaerisporangium rufum]|uniref:Uncharacterized protein n=1 Tax=Sphaerisporangium rufum TaxID=1381558 RepID=A0A919V7L3_9ACTN|nr:hypothetical protein [Sphaerisporangium rufum]GII80505.1 hypothetical protein Sru01_54870 [Sphaerisporangium rufum]